MPRSRVQSRNVSSKNTSRNFFLPLIAAHNSLASGWGSGAVDFPYLVSPADALTESFNTSESTYNEEKPEITGILTNSAIKEISASAAKQDLCFAFINSDSGEAYIADQSVRGDRNDLYAQKDGDKMVLAVAEKCQNTIVVIHAVGPVIVEKWVEHENVKAVIFAHLPGQESGNALVCTQGSI